MPVNALTRKVGLKVGPVVVETLLNRYFDRVKAQDGKGMTKLREDELLYDAAFNMIKAFLEQCCLHTVEDVQGFANTRTPSPPWVHVVRLLIPMSCCDEAARYLTTALGGSEAASRIVGGVKWWQVRGVSGIDAQWVTAKKDWIEMKRRHKVSEKLKDQDGTSADTTADTGVYEREMDAMPCILYSHGGGYYFGSVDQERYCIQRHARKINGRVFAVNYRLAPQYPFPCAIQDLLAGYLFLIQPPPGAEHCPVKPAHIIIIGDSAGGGLVLALLQVIRDAGLPQPAGGVLISPWCDLTHSFPSIHTNTATDVMPECGLSIQKPSTLWPPPSNEMTCKVHASLRSRIRQSLRMRDSNHHAEPTAPLILPQPDSTAAEMPTDVGSTAPLPSHGNETVSLVATSGEILTIDKQIQLYAPNSLITHPLISPALSYLGGLPPLLFIVSDKEVLRDEIIYTAHKAATPEKFPIKEDARRLYPVLNGIEKKYEGTKVHLQVYDDAAHVLPVLFAFTTPGKFCYRAIATFCKHVTGMNLQSPLSPALPVQSSFSAPDVRKAKKRQDSFFGNLFPSHQRSMTIANIPQRPPLSPAPMSPSTPSSESSTKRSLIFNFSRRPSAIRNSQNIPTSNSDTSNDLAEFDPDGWVSPQTPPGGDRTAGQGIVYSETLEFPSWKDGMIRERVSTQGVIRPLEPENELDAFHVSSDVIGVLSELVVRRYIECSTKLDKKFAKVIKAIEKDRHRHLERVTKDIHAHITQLQTVLLCDDREVDGGMSAKGIKEGLMAVSSSWGWAWALDGHERPPPSSIVSRRDTDEARRLARIADKCVLPGDPSVSGNNLWSIVVNFLSTSPDKNKFEGQQQKSPGRDLKSRFPRFRRRGEVVCSPDVNE